MGKLLRFARKKPAEQRDRSAPEGPRPAFRGRVARVFFSSDARAQGPFVSDARRSSDRSRAGRRDPEIERRYRFRRRGTMGILVAIFIVGTAAAWIGDGGVLDLARKREARDALAKEVRAQERKVERLREEVERLRTDPGAVERVAREELGYVKKGEITLLLSRDTPDLAEQARRDAENTAQPAP